MRVTQMFSPELSQVQRMGATQFITVEDAQAMGQVAAHLVADELCRKPDATIVFPTGKTPLPMNVALKDMTAQGKLDWRKSRLFHLDEYVNPQPEAAPAYKTFAQEIDSQLWDGLPGARKHYFKDYPDPQDYERAVMGPDGEGPDLVILGIGANGHIAFNEPGSAENSPSRTVDLAEDTLRQNFGDLDKPGCPIRAVTLGLRAILSAKKIILLATQGKETIVRQAFEPLTPPSENLPASWLKRHPNVVVVTDFKVFD